MKCYCCKEELNNKNSSEEHILLNSIGGKLKSKDLLCKKCNSKFGEKNDSELSKQLLFLSTFLNIQRERGDHPTLKGATTKSGEEIHLLSGGIPSYSKPTVETIADNNKIVINIRARNEKELKQIAKGLAKKYRQVSADDIITMATHKTGYIKEPIKVTQTIGGDVALNAISKIGINYFVYKTKQYESISSIIDVLKNDIKNNLCKHYYPDKLYQKEPKEVCHIIHIESNKSNKNIIAYVELFSSFSFIVLLSDNYNGKSIKSTYCYDLNKNKELIKKISLKIKTVDFNRLPVICGDYCKTITEKINRTVKIGLEKQTDNEISSITSRCIDEILKVRYGHNECITEQMLSELSNCFAVEFVKFIYRDL